MWQPEEAANPPITQAPESWAVIRQRLDHRLIGAYCAMRYDGRSRSWVMRELDFDERELDAAIRRGSEVYGHDVNQALQQLGRPLTAEERAARRPRFGRAAHPERVA